MGEPTDSDALTADLMAVVQLLARDAVASAMAAGTTPGPQGVTLARGWASSRPPSWRTSGG